MIKSRPNFALIAPGWERGILTHGQQSCDDFSVGRFTCKERVMLIEREIRLLFSVLCKQVVFCHVQT